MARHPGHVKPFTYGSVCSGIEAATVAWEPLRWHPAFFAEIDRFPSAVLKHHYPDVPNAGDFTTIQEGDYATIDLLVGGTPCQDFSVAGLRAGVAGERGNLTLEFLRLAQRLRPRWLVWENVPGVYSSTSHVITHHGELREGHGDEGERRYLQDCEADESHAFACFLAGLQELGYGFAYRTLDAQYAGVPQRRRRVFVVGYLGDWRRAAAVLFERHSLSGNPPPRREARQGSTHDLAPCLGASGRGFRNAGDTRGQDAVVATAFGGNNCSGPIDVATAVNACATASGRMDFESETFVVDGPVSTLDSSYGRLQGCSGQDANHGHSHLVPVAAHTTGAGFWQEGLGTLRGREQDSHENLVVHPSEGCLTPNAPQRCRVYGVDGVAPTLQCEEGRGHGVPTIAIQAGCVRENPDSGPDGIGVREDGIAYTLEARAEVQAVAFRTNAAGQVDCQGDKAAAVTTMTDPCSQFIATVAIQNALRGKSQNGLGITDDDTMYTLDQGSQHAVAFESRFVRNGRGAPSDIVAPLKAQSGETGKGDGAPLVATTMAVRRLTALECERLQGFPTVVQLRFEEMTRDEVCVAAVINGDITVDADAGKIYRHRGPGGVRLDVPIEVAGTNVNGYLCMNLTANGVKKQVRLHRLVWISVYGIPEDALIVGHKDNDKQNNRIGNLKLLTQELNSTEAAMDGLYIPREKLTVEMRTQLFHDHRSGGGSYSALAQRYGITKGRVGQIVRELGYTQISDKTADGPRYKALGNSMAVPCMRWIGERIQMVEAL